MSLAGVRIVVGVGGGIAAYKAVTLVRSLLRLGAEARVVITNSATRFVGPTTFSGLTGKATVVDLWDPSYPGEVHVELAQWAQALVIAPATANLLARAATGMADDALLATLSCAGCPVFYAPAMHERMWQSPATQRNVRALAADGAHLIGPVSGPLASGAVGMGRMVEPEAIAEAVAKALGERAGGAGGDLSGKTVLISAGPTLEDIDPVRYISNRSSGRMGFAIASAAVDRGARVIVVHGPTEVAPPSGIEGVKVRSALDMHAAVFAALPSADAVVMTAAVADYRPAQAQKAKIKKKADRLTIELIKNPDILAELGQRRGRRKRPVLVGFAMETNDLLAYARRKLEQKRCDFIVANEAAVGFGGDDNVATLVGPGGDEALPKMSKRELADRILDRVLALLAGPVKPGSPKPRRPRARRPARRPKGR